MGRDPRRREEGVKSVQGGDRATADCVLKQVTSEAAGAWPPSPGECWGPGGSTALSGPGRGAVGHLLHPCLSGGRFSHPRSSTSGLSGSGQRQHLSTETAETHSWGCPTEGREAHSYVTADALVSRLPRHTHTRRWRGNPLPLSKELLLSSISREPRPGNCAPAGQSWGGCVLCALLAAPSPSSFPRGPRRRLRGWQLGPDWPGLNRCSASQARLAATGASQPAFVPLAACSVPSLFSPGQAGQAEALKPWKQHRPPVPFQLFPPPGSFLRLRRPPGVLALPQPGSEQNSTHCPQPHPPWHLSWARAERAKGVLELWGSLT